MFRHPLVRDIAVVLVVKVALILIGFWAFFGPQHRPAVDAAAVEDLLFATSGPAAVPQPPYFHNPGENWP